MYKIPNPFQNNPKYKFRMLGFILQKETSYGLIKLLLTIRDQEDIVDVQDFINLTIDVLFLTTRTFEKSRDALFERIKKQTYENAGDDETEKVKETKEVPNILDLSSRSSEELDPSDIPKEKVEKWCKALS